MSVTSIISATFLEFKLFVVMIYADDFLTKASLPNPFFLHISQKTLNPLQFIFFFY